jgi:hypothetical protein
MYIISKSKDYYDSCASLGIDKTLIYKRDLITDENTSVGEDICEKFLTPSGMWDKYKTSIYASRNAFGRRHLGLFLHIVGFCGKLYPLIQYRHEVGSALTPISEYFYTQDLDRLKALVEKDDTLSMCLTLDRYHGYGTKKKESEWIRFTKAVHDLNEVEYLDPFVKYSVPVFIVGLVPHLESKKHMLLLNTTLKEQEFYRVKDPHTAWQEISMFLGGVIPRQVPETVEIKDKDRITGHGFDKWSFRKQGKNYQG